MNLRHNNFSALTFVALATFVVAAAAQNKPPGGGGSTSNSDVNFKAYGAPIFFMFALFVAVGLTHKSLVKVIALVKGNAAAAAPTLGGCVAGIVSSFFLTWTAGWAYGLVSSLLFYTSILGLAAPPGSANAGQTANFSVLMIWFLNLVGMTNFTTGVINSVSTDNCNSYYGHRKDKMCKKGWLTFATINCTVIISITFLAIFSLMAQIVEGENPGGADGTYEQADDDDSANLQKESKEPA